MGLKSCYYLRVVSVVLRVMTRMMDLEMELEEDQDPVSGQDEEDWRTWCHWCHCHRCVGDDVSRGMLSGLVSSGDWHRSGHCGNTWPGARTCALTMSGHWRDQDTHSVNILCNISIVNTIIRSDRLSTMIGTTVFRLLSVQWRGHDYYCSWHIRDLKVHFFYQCSLIKETLKEHL